MVVFSRPLHDMTHEEIAHEALSIGRRTGNKDLEQAGRNLLDAVEHDRDSQEIVDLIDAMDA